MREIIEYKGLKIEVWHDDNCPDPLKDWDGQGGFYHWQDPAEYGKYCEFLGYDEKTREQIRTDHPDAVRIDKYEHSGISYSVHETRPHCQFDTSSVYAVWMPDKYLLAELDKLGVTERYKKCVKYAKQACELFSYWINGDVYGWATFDHNGNELDSCGSYFGYGDIQDAIKTEAQESIDRYLKDIKENIKTLVVMS